MAICLYLGAILSFWWTRPSILLMDNSWPNFLANFHFRFLHLNKIKWTRTATNGFLNDFHMKCKLFTVFWLTLLPLMTNILKILRITLISYNSRIQMHISSTLRNDSALKQKCKKKIQWNGRETKISRDFISLCDLSTWPDFGTKK